MGIGRTNEIDQVAGDWLVRRDSENWSAADQERLEGWLSASTLNRVAFLRLELAWEDAARLKALGAGIQSDQPPPPGHWNLTPFFDPRSTASPSASEASRRWIAANPRCGSRWKQMKKRPASSSPVAGSIPSVNE